MNTNPWFETMHIPCGHGHCHNYLCVCQLFRFLCQNCNRPNDWNIRPSLFVWKSTGATPGVIVFSEAHVLFMPQAGYVKWDQSMVMAYIVLCLDLHPLHAKSSEIYVNALHILMTYGQFWLGKIIWFTETAVIFEVKNLLSFLRPQVLF